MRKKMLEQYRWFLCLLLLVWISRSSIAQSQDESTEYFNVKESAEDDVLERNDDLLVDERREALKRILHEQLEHVTHAEQTEEHYEKEHHSKPKESQEQEQEEQDDEDEEVREYNPWQDSFQDQYEDGTYVYGFSLPNGITRYERKFFSEEYKSPVVEGFYTQPRFYGKHKLYELRCYHVDYYTGYKPLKVQYLSRPPIVRRDEKPNVDCFQKE